MAAKLGISRQNVSKWETDETVPDIRQSKKMAVLAASDDYDEENGKKVINQIIRTRIHGILREGKPLYTLA